jgi:hypothetical protein
MSGREVDGALIRRIDAAIMNSGARRSLIQHDWPECHRKNCQGSHGDVDIAFHEMKIAIMQAVKSELECEVTTKPDIADDGDTPEQVAVYTLATLLNRYNVHHAGTFVRSAQLIIDAYPGITEVLGEAA